MPDRLQLCANKINNNFEDYTLLDAGCRTKDLKKYLIDCRDYYGADLESSEGVLKCDLSQELPFNDSEFDIVVALDVIEHLDNPHSALREIIRIAKKSVFISFMI